jgi:hypothetical protein
MHKKTVGIGGCIAFGALFLGLAFFVSCLYLERGRRHSPLNIVSIKVVKSLIEYKKLQ